MNSKIIMKDLTLPELKKEKLILEIKLAIINNLIRVPFCKRETEMKELQEIIKKHNKK